MTDDPQTRNTIEADAKRLAQAMAIAHNAAKLEHLLFIVEQHIADDHHGFQPSILRRN